MSWAGPLRAIATAVLFIGCAHGPPPPLHTARLEIDRSKGHFRPFVRAKVAGQRMLLLVDTGAFHSMLPPGFGRAHHLRRASSAFERTAIDANGNRSVASLLPDVPVQFDGEASDGAMDFLENASGDMRYGVLAPQDLVRPGWAVVIDLEREELRYESEEGALKRLGGSGPPLTNIEFHACGSAEFFKSPRRLVATTINGTPVDMEVDTGADGTVLARNNPALRSMLATEGERGGLRGMISTGQALVVDGVSIGFSNLTFVVSALVVPTSYACGAGVIGADVLRHCTIVWAWKSLWSACHAPPSRE